MRWGYLSVVSDMGLTEGLWCTCCRNLETDIIYFLVDDWTAEQEMWIKRIWNVKDLDSDFHICEDCMDGYCGVNLGYNADTWLERRIEEYEAKRRSHNP